MPEQSKTIIVALGSNTEAPQHMQQAKSLLESAFADIRFSPSMQTEPVGIASDPFLNAVGVAKTHKSQDQVTALLKQTEQACGNSRALREQRKILMDIDLLQYGDTRLHLQDWNRSYIKTLLKNIGLDASEEPSSGRKPLHP